MWLFPFRGLEKAFPVSKNGFRGLEMVFSVSKNGFRGLEMVFSVSKNGFRGLEKVFSVSKNRFRGLETFSRSIPLRIVFFAAAEAGEDPEGHVVVVSLVMDEAQVGLAVPFFVEPDAHLPPVFIPVSF